MISVQEADNIIFGKINKFPACRLPLGEAFGMVLREDIVADRDLPPFHRVTMDGIAISSASWDMGNRIFAVEGTQKAGESPVTLKDRSSCIEIMTGAVLPKGCDGVIPVEHVDIRDGKAAVGDKALFSSMVNVHAQGADHKQGDALVSAGARLGPAQVAVAASAGYTEVSVTQSPHIALIGTGDELVGIDQAPKPFQIRQSNSYALEAACRLNGYHQVSRLHMADNKRSMLKSLKKILKTHDVLVLSGGVSMGKFDFVPDVLGELGVDVLFHRVKQRPGRPFWFGRNKEGKPVFALPGNPVSTQVGMARYVLPYLNKASGAALPSPEFARLKEDLEVGTPLTCFQPVALEGDPQGHLWATPVVPNSSGDFASLAGSDGFLELPAESLRFARGFSARLYRF